MDGHAVYKEEPRDFKSKLDVVGCFVEYGGKILLLHRQDHKPEGNTWCVPGGKCDKGEELEVAMLRELREEAGIDAVGNIKYVNKVYVRYPSYDFVYHLFHFVLDQMPELAISEGEHKAHCFVTPVEAKHLPLIPGEAECIDIVYGVTN